MTNRSTAAWTVTGLCAAFVGLVWLVFGQTLGHQFVNLDDGAYVFRNSQVIRGLSIEGIRWAFTHPVAANWHPLTMLSHMLDCQLYGLSPAGHHLTNVVLHAMSVLLLFFAFWQMTRALWKSAFVAAVFAIHPLHVESVAWIAERKDVLSALFFTLTIIAYVHYTRRPSLLRYFLVLFVFACGLLAKPMLVTVPFILLLLDYWPLNRAQRSAVSDQKSSDLSWTKLLLEKVPLLVLSAAASVGTIVTQEQSIQHFSLGARLGNAFVSVMTYLRQTIWPRDLAVFYPYPDNGLPFGELSAAIAIFAAITFLAFFLRRKRPYVWIGWLWFVGMLIPVIGLVQVGIQAHADRYNYLPQIGLTLIATWAFTDLSRGRPYGRAVIVPISLAVVIALAWIARIQSSYWFDSQSLWEHALAVAPDNEMVREHLSEAYLSKGRIEDSIAQGREAARLLPQSADAHGVLGAALARTSELEEARSELLTALKLNPKLARARFNLANVLLQQGNADAAVASYQSELDLYPNFAEGHNNLANALLRMGQLDKAREHLRIALQLNPKYPEAHNNLAIVLSQTEGLRQAINEWEKTLLIDPNNLEAHSNLAWVLATSASDNIRNGPAALDHAERALHLSKGSNPRTLRLVAAANAEMGRFDAAIDAAEHGLRLAESQNDEQLIRTLEANIASFKHSTPLRDSR